MEQTPHRPKIDLVAQARAAGIGRGLPDGFIPRCPTCRYLLKGLAEPRCPECGSAFSMPALIADWHARQNAPPSNIDFTLGAILTLVSFIPADLRDPGALFWKLILLPALWGVTGVWVYRRREDFEEPDQAHRLLWVWAPCAATAAALVRTPIVGPLTATLMLTIAASVGVISWRRAPVPTAIIASLALIAPAAIAVFMGIGLLLSGLAGAAQGHHWSPADYPGWYWRGVAGRTRGIPNDRAVAIGPGA